MEITHYNRKIHMHTTNTIMIKFALMAMVLESGIHLCHGATPLDASAESKIIGSLCSYECYATNAVPCDPQYTAGSPTCATITPAPGTYGIPEDTEIIVGEVCEDPQPENVDVITSIGKNDACLPAVYAEQNCIPPPITLGDSCATINVYNCFYNVVITHDVGDNPFFGPYDIITATCSCTQTVSENSPFVSGPTQFGGSGEPCP
jgi:hypothetical protein